ncbi:metal-dependent hydrolase [Actinomadura macrotermitis]|uniref:Metal-dependent hydrolase n=1 Tax=Actinomadura macrotermitis TaxID=2585200 RepID=A0A7K0BW89_9ACTN|nr:metal-dependent hydrolase [Actinomadura macrotermitis]MQY05431.1 hypothetical protein [Actinomadura macrotermitis]
MQPRYDERHPLIKPRRVSFDWEQTSVHWIPGDPLGAHFFNAFHTILPAGERWFIQALKEALPAIKDERLREEVKGFMGQESVHAYSHQNVLEKLLESNGIDTRKITDEMNAGLADRAAKRAKMSPRKARRTLLFELAAICTLEHYTAVSGQWILTNTALDRAGADPTMLDMFRWHGAEEVEHRAVVFDVYQQLGGGYPARAAAWAVTVLFLYWAMVAGTLYLVRQDKAITGRTTKLQLWKQYRRSVRAGHVPPIFSLLLREAKVYLDPRHHPSQVHDLGLAADYLSRSPAALKSA